MSATFCRLPFEYVRAFLVGSSSNRSSIARCRFGSRRAYRAAGTSRSMASPPVSFGHSVTSPGRRRAGDAGSTASPQGSPPSNQTCPPSSCEQSEQHPIAVDLPDPFGPRNP